MAETHELAVGERATDFTLTDVNGHTVSLHDYLGKNNVYIFFVREFN